MGGPDAATPTCQILPPGIPGYRRFGPFTVNPSPGGAWVGPDLAAARALVAASGTHGMRVVLWSPDDSQTLGDFIVSVLRELGYRASMVTRSRPVLYNAINDSRRRIQITDGSWYADYPSASDFFDLSFRCSAWRLADPSAVRDSSFFCDHALDREMDVADEEEATAPSRAASTWAAVDRGVTYAAPWVPLVNLTWVDFVSSRVSGYEYNPAFQGVLLDQLVVRQ
jgi:peptide/nickel transport system substrate-binding protein